MKFYLIILKNSTNLFNVLSKIQQHLNNKIFAIIIKSSNETIYEFTLLDSLNLLKFINKFIESTWKFFANTFFFVVTRVKIEIVDSIAFVQINAKHCYNRKYQLLYIRFDDYALIRLYKKYNISSTIVLKSKYNQQYVDSFKIFEKIEQLTYRLNLSTHWRIYLVFSIAQLKSSSSLNIDFFRRKRSNHFDSIFVENDTNIMKFFEIERLINKRQTKRRELEYLIR